MGEVHGRQAGEATESSTERVIRLLAERDYVARVREFTETTRSAADAARALECSVGQIAKSIVFRAATSDRAVLVVASGASRVDERKVAELIGEQVGKASAAFVRERTGFAIGGVPPVWEPVAGLPASHRVLFDADLLEYDEVWAAAGTPNSVFAIAPGELCRIVGGLAADVRQE